MDHPGRHRTAGVITTPQRHRQAGFDERDVLRRGGRPADDRPGVEVDRERDVGEPGPGRDVGEVGNPGPVRGGGAEVAVEQIPCAHAVLAGDGGADLAAADQAPHALLAHQPVDGVFRDPGVPGALQPGGHLAAPVEDLRQRPAGRAARPQPAQRVDDAGVGEDPRRGRVGAPGPVGAWGDRHALLAQDRADRLDPITSGPLLVDEPGDQRWRGSSSLAKKIEAAFKISLASRRSAFSLLQPLDLGQLLAAGTRPRAGVGLGLQHPLTQRLRPDPELGPERVRHRPRRAVLIESIQGHPSRALPLLSGVPVGHDLHPSQERKRHQTRDGSVCQWVWAVVRNPAGSSWLVMAESVVRCWMRAVAAWCRVWAVVACWVRWSSSSARSR